MLAWLTTGAAHGAHERQHLVGMLVGALAALAGAELDAQAVRMTTGVPTVAQRPTAAESIAYRRRAQGAQRDFERARRAGMPVLDGYGGTRCDVTLGRMCYWHDEERPRIHESAPVRRARERLITRLGESAERIPSDEWVVGQRVRYLVEQGRAGDGVLVAEGCVARALVQDRTEGRDEREQERGMGEWEGGGRGEAGESAGRSGQAVSSSLTRWCEALDGFAHHVAGEFVEAELAFARSLDAMSDAERCAWNDISLLLDGVRAKRYRALGCGTREAFERRFWALTRPLYVLDANDARTEFLARRVMARLERDARDAHDMVWGDDRLELLLRYGWETEWGRTSPSMSDPSRVRILGFEPSPAFEFPPDDRAFADPAHAADYGWSPRNQTAYTRYAPRYASAFTAPPNQVAFFRRGDSAIVVAALDLRRDSLFQRDSIDAALAILADSSDSAAVVRVRDASRAVRMVARSHWGAALVSVEALDTVLRHAARARHGAWPPDTSIRAPLAISDMLVLEQATPLPDSLEDAVPMSRGDLRASVLERLGLFWELYPLAVDTVVRYTLTVKPLDEGSFHRLARRLGLARRLKPVHMQWEEPLAQHRAFVPRALAIDVSALPAGRYAIEIAAESAGTRASARREIRLWR